MTPAALIDRATRFAVLLERIKAGEVKNFDKALDEAGEELKRMLAELGPLDSVSRREFEARLAEFRREMLRIETAETERHLGRMEELAGRSTEYQAASLERVGASKVRVPEAKKAMAAALRDPIAATGELLEPFLKDASERQAERMANAARNCWSRGMTTDQAVRALLGTRSARYNDGELARAKRSMATAIRTSVSHVDMAAQEIFMEQNSDVVKGYRWVATLDHSTSSLCRSLDGRVFLLGDKSAPRKPAHPNCRSTTVPELDDEFDWLGEGATRSSADGPVPQGETYYSWLAKQDAAFQDDVLGKARGKLFREGGLDAEEFARLNLGRDFKPLTLEEMEKADPASFKRAFG